MRCPIPIHGGGYIATANFSLRNFPRFRIRKQLRRIISQRPRRVRRKKDIIGVTLHLEYSRQLSRRQIFPIAFETSLIRFFKTLLRVILAARHTGLFSKSFNFCGHMVSRLPGCALNADTLCAIPFGISRSIIIGSVHAAACHQKVIPIRIRFLIFTALIIVQMKLLPPSRRKIPQSFIAKHATIVKSYNRSMRSPVPIQSYVFE